MFEVKLTGSRGETVKQRVPYPTLGGMRFVLEQIAIRDPKAKNVNPESFMDVRFVKQLEDSGFIQTLYPKG